jgi:hypothetical protein
MNSEEIKHLLEKYYDGESTDEEELLLKNFFRQAEIPEDLIDEKEIFSYYMDSAEVPEPSSGFEDRIISAIDSLDQIAVNPNRRKILGILSGIAAGMLILAGSYFFFIHKSEPNDTYSDPEIAYAETMKILYDVSSRLNHGTQALDRIGSMQNVTRESLETVSRSATTIREKMKPLENLRKAMELIDTNYDKN